MTAHEVLHGNLTKNKTLSIWICLPISVLNFISPSYWRYWHNFHHRYVDYWTPEGRPLEIGFESKGYPKLRNILGKGELFFYKTLHLLRSQLMFIFVKEFRTTKFLKLRLATLAELLIIIAFNVSLFLFLSFEKWIFIFLIPLLIQNLIAGLFLMTQHSEHLDKNDSANLRIFSVKMPQIFEWIFLRSGYHFEHHLFPNANFTKLHIIRNEIANSYPQLKYEYPIKQALEKIYK